MKALRRVLRNLALSVGIAGAIVFMTWPGNQHAFPLRAWVLLFAGLFVFLTLVGLWNRWYEYRNRF